LPTRAAPVAIFVRAGWACRRSNDGSGVKPL
jgi:hypothetical protein